MEPHRSWLTPVFETMEAGDAVGVISVVSEAEALVLPLRQGNSELIREYQETFAKQFIEIVVTDRYIGRSAADLRARLGLDLPDAIILASALATDCQTVIGNDKACATRFKDIPYIYLDDAVRAR